MAVLGSLLATLSSHKAVRALWRVRGLVECGCTKRWLKLTSDTNSGPLSPLLWESSCRPQLTFRPLLKLFLPPHILDSVVLSMLEEVILYFSFLVWVIICACYLFLTRPSAWIILLHLTFILLPTFWFLVLFCFFFLHPQTPTCPSCLFKLKWKHFSV